MSRFFVARLTSGLIVADMQFLIRKEISFVNFVFSPTVKEKMVKCDIKKLREKVTYEIDNI